MRANRTLRSFLSAFCLLLTAYCLPGCNIGGALAYKAFGPAKVKADYAPPKQPLLVLVENYSHSADLQPSADQLGTLVIADLKAHKVGPLVDPNPLYTLRSEKPGEYEKMKIPDIGRFVGAKQVIYVDLQECQVKAVPGADVIKGKIAAKVRVVDVDTGQTKWPDTGVSHPVETGTDYVRKETDAPLAVRGQMIQELSMKIGRLFYGHQPDYDLGRGEPD